MHSKCNFFYTFIVCSLPGTQTHDFALQCNILLTEPLNLNIYPLWTFLTTYICIVKHIFLSTSSHIFVLRCVCLAAFGNPFDLRWHVLTYLCSSLNGGVHKVLSQDLFVKPRCTNFFEWLLDGMCVYKVRENCFTFHDWRNGDGYAGCQCLF